MLIDPEAPAAAAALLAQPDEPRLGPRPRPWRRAGPRGEGSPGRARRSPRGGCRPDGCRILLLTQPRFLGYVFNPVSFWLVHRGAALVAVIAEVSNTYGDRHSYLCHRPGFAAIEAGDSTTATKLLHVSPFLEVSGGYDFGFDIRPDRIAIRIALSGGPEGLVATLTGDRRPLTSGSILVAAVRRPFGALRTIALIHWEALRLTLKGARYRPRPAPPVEEIT